MTFVAEIGLLEVKKPRWWVRRIRFLRELWDNPIFQRCYRRHRVKQHIRPFPSLLIGFAYSTILSVILFLSFGDDYDLFTLFLSIGIVGLLFIILMAMVVYAFINCVVRLSIDIYSDIARGSATQTLTAPVTDSDLYFGECLPPFVRGVEIVELLICFALGTIPPYMAAILYGLMKLENVSLGFELFYPPVTLFFIIVYGFSLVVMMLIFSLAAGWFSISMTPSVSSLVTVIYIIVVNHVLSLALIPMMFLMNIFILVSESLESIPLTIGFFVLNYLVFLGIVSFLVYVVCRVTSRLGICAMGRARRP